MPLSTPQQTIVDNPARFKVVSAGRRFGKTFLALRELCREATRPHSRVWAIAPTRMQAKGLFWEPLKDKLYKLRWVKRVNETELSILLVNGSLIELKSGDSFDRMRGYSVDFTVWDEFADIDSEAWTVVRPTLADRQGRALFIGTPKGSQNWARDMYDQSLTNSDWASFSYTTIEGGNVTAEEIEAAKRDMDDRTFQQEFLATFVDAGNQVFYAFKRVNNIRPYTGGTPTQLHIGMDFNVGNMSATIGVINGSELHIIDEIKLVSSNTDEMVDEIKKRYSFLASERITIYPDPSGSAMKTSASGRSDHIILRNAGFVVKSPNKHNPVRDGINAVNSRFETAAGTHHLFVDSKCKYTVESMERFTYKEGSSQPDKDSGYDHFADSLRYLVDYVWPVRKQIETRPPQRWVVK